jgi:hypothetical protein
MGTEATSKDAETAPQQHPHHTPSLMLQATACRVDEEYENDAGNNNDNKMMGMMVMMMGTTAMMTGTMAMMTGTMAMMMGTMVMTIVRVIFMGERTTFTIFEGNSFVSGT